jgi:elongation factor Ts
MAQITAALVKELREQTGIGMMECKKALTENDGDLQKAILWLRERGMSRAAKKSGRTTAEGVVKVMTSDDMKTGVVVELNSETDFSAKNEEFQAFAEAVTKTALNSKVANIDELRAATLEGTSSNVADALTALIAKVGENMTLRRVNTITSETGVVVPYSHMGGKICTLIRLEGATGENVVELGKDLAMHAAAASPRYLSSSEVPADLVKQEEELARKKLLEEGKPADKVEMILKGQIGKFYKEICLMDQGFIKEPKKSVANVIKDSGTGVELASYVRIQLGEGIEKAEDNFAAEVAAMTK